MFPAQLAPGRTPSSRALDRFLRLSYHFHWKGAHRVKTEVSIEYCVV